MNIIKRVFTSKREVEKIQTKARRAFDAAKMGRLQSDWAATPVMINQELRQSLRVLKSRSREAAKNDSTMKKYIAMRKVNIVGAEGIKLVANVKDQNGLPDTMANKLIEDCFEDFSFPENFTTAGNLSRREVEDMAVASLAYDGEFISRMVPGFDNDHNFAIEILDSMLLDYQFSVTTQLTNGNWLMNGIEIDQWKRPVNYYFRNTRPDSYDYSVDSDYNIIPASEILHLFYKEFPNQFRGIPMGSAALQTIHYMKGYTEAEIIAARMEACKSTYLIGDDTTDIEDDDAKDPNELSGTMEPGTRDILPKGWDVKEVSPTHPNGNYSDFIKQNKRDTANGLNVAYNELANDLEGVNYSSIRQGVLYERDCWKAEQQFVGMNFNRRYYNEWLKMQLLNGNLQPLPFSKYVKFKKAKWQGRRWSWIDPKSDILAAQMAVANGFKSRQQICHEEGTEFENNIEQLKQEKPHVGNLILDLSQSGSTANSRTPKEEDPESEKK